MFLLSKLDSVARLFPRDIENTREFLLDRGIPAGSLEALPPFSARLATDPSFRRDVTSLVQAVIQREAEAVDYMDLLGILVLAAAGAGPFASSVPVAATDQQEESVREILRFLTQVRRPTGAVAPVFVHSQNAIAPVLASEPSSPHPSPLQPPRGDDVLLHPVSSPPPFDDEEPTPSRWKGTPIWIGCTVALALALASAWFIHQKNATTPETTATSEPALSPTLPPSENNSPPPAPARHPRTLPPLVPRKPSPAHPRPKTGLHTRRVEPAFSQPPAPIRRQPSLQSEQIAPPLKLSSPAQPTAAAASAPPPRPFNTPPASAPIAAPPVNTAATTTPSVRRRLPKSVVINQGPPRRPAASYSSAPGVVHPASIGMMASNLISSPTPAYPPAASQARVQGEVTVRAVVDREGNVVDARVVSGPEMLRDASLEAVQHWRYRPYLQRGKPTEVATTAVLDFELP